MWCWDVSLYSIVDLMIGEDADDKTTASLLSVMAANSGFGVRRQGIIGNNDVVVHPPGVNASTSIIGCCAHNNIIQLLCEWREPTQDASAKKRREEI